MYSNLFGLGLFRLQRLFDFKYSAELQWSEFPHLCRLMSALRTIQYKNSRELVNSVSASAVFAFSYQLVDCWLFVLYTVQLFVLSEGSGT